jgi:DNA polymerase bacteriophage-type
VCVGIDIETFSPNDISHGLDVYKQGAELLCLAWQREGHEAKVWDATAGDMPGELYNLLRNSGEILCAHNSQFEATLLAQCLPQIQIDPKRWRCSMARAYAHGLPGSLDALSQVFKLPEDKAKMKDGRKLMLMFSKANKEGQRKTRHTHPNDWARFLEYCRMDVVSMMELWAKLPAWNYPNNPDELALWQLDQEINQRGFPVDLDLARAAVRAVEAKQKELASRTVELTQGEVQAATQRDALLKHLLEEHGVELPDMQASTLERRLGDQDLPDEVRELISIRLQATTSSTAKYKKLLTCVGPDGRLRNTLQFCGASRTGRWSGRLFQPQNLPRQDMPQEQIEADITALKLGAEDLLVDDVMRSASNALRGVIIPGPGRKLVVADLSAIEGRVAAWLASEQWKIESFANGVDQYKATVASTFNIDVAAVTKEQRSLGKVEELAFQFGGSVGAVCSACAIYRVDVNELAKQVLLTCGTQIRIEAEEMWDWAVEKGIPTYDLTKTTYMGCDALKRLWRRSNSAIVAFWDTLQEAAQWAIELPGEWFPVGKFLKCRRDGAWLRMGLPSGRFLCYAMPKIGIGKYDKPEITFHGVSPYTKQWGRIHTRGAKLFENSVQSVARDVLAASMPKIADYGYELVLTSHDEPVCLAPCEDRYNPTHLSSLLATVPDWAPGLPLAAAGYETTTRYKKE